MENTTIRFPNLGFEVHPGMSIDVFGIKIAYYGVIIMLAMLLGAVISCLEARRTKQNIEDYIDFLMYTLIASIVGARLYYVLFEWGYYSRHPLEIITGLREGGLAIYGGIIAATLTLWIFSRKRKLSFRLMADTACLGLVAGQILGRWGNFFNREAFGGYTDNLLAMMLPVDRAKGLTADLLSKTVEYQGNSYVQVHPTFLYEGLWNLVLLLLLLLFRKHKKADGEVAALYLVGYGIGRLWIEALRTDQLLFWHSGVPVSQVLSFVLVVVASVWFSIGRYRIYKQKVTQIKEENKKKSSTFSH